MIALFVTPAKALQPGGGGVQSCTREYIAVLKAAGISLREVPWNPNLTLIQRLAHRLHHDWSRRAVARRISLEATTAIHKHKPHFVFHNFYTSADVVREISGLFPDVQQVLLSHGVEAIDMCIEQRLRRRDGMENKARGYAEGIIGNQFLQDAAIREHLHAVFTLSPSEVFFEQWLGARQASWLPRIILEQRLQSQPIDGRVGCVSTLDHPPNLDGLVQLLQKLKDSPETLRFRLIGGPTAAGSALAQRFRFVDYLGPVSDTELRAEASTWCCFAHPLFVAAKGCSTKLATALGWGIPIATTHFGCRGYKWNHQLAPVASNASQLATDVIRKSRASTFDCYREETAAIVKATPTVFAVAELVREALGLHTTPSP